MSFDINQVTGQQWRDLLEKAKASHEGKDSSHRYIVLKSGKLELSDQLSPDAIKLSLKEIIDISKKKIQELTKENKFEIKTEDITLITTIKDCVDVLIESKIKKREEPLKKIMRVAALVISAIASVALIGVPFLVLLRTSNQKFENEIKELKSSLEEMLDEYEKKSIAITNRKNLLMSLVKRWESPISQEVIDQALQQKEVTVRLDQHLEYTHLRLSLTRKDPHYIDKSIAFMSELTNIDKTLNEIISAMENSKENG